MDVSKTQASFENFFNNFLDPSTGQPLYPRILQEIVSQESWNINLNCQNLAAFDPELYCPPLCARVCVPLRCRLSLSVSLRVLFLLGLWSAPSD